MAGIFYRLSAQHWALCKASTYCVCYAVVSRSPEIQGRALKSSTTPGRTALHWQVPRGRDAHECLSSLNTEVWSLGSLSGTGHGLQQDSGRQYLPPSVWLPWLPMPARQVYQSPALLNSLWTTLPGFTGNTQPVTLVSASPTQTVSSQIGDCIHRQHLHLFATNPTIYSSIYSLIPPSSLWNTRFN